MGGRGCAQGRRRRHRAASLPSRLSRHASRPGAHPWAAGTGDVSLRTVELNGQALRAGERNGGCHCHRCGAALSGAAGKKGCPGAQS